MTLGSLFSGSGGFEWSATLCGIEPLWGSEGVDFCGIEEATFMKLRSQLLELLEEASKGE